MAKSKKEKKPEDEQLATNDSSFIDAENAEDSEFSNSTIALMPELEELVKKNPNRLIGCGG